MLRSEVQQKSLQRTAVTSKSKHPLKHSQKNRARAAVPRESAAEKPLRHQKASTAAKNGRFRPPTTTPQAARPPAEQSMPRGWPASLGLRRRQAETTPKQIAAARPRLLRGVPAPPNALLRGLRARVVLLDEVSKPRRASTCCVLQYTTTPPAGVARRARGRGELRLYPR